MTRIQLIYANYGCAEEIRSSIHSIEQIVDVVHIDIVVIENGGDPLEIAKVNVPIGCSLRVIVPGKNVGYFGALRAAIGCPSNTNEYEYRVLCNPDIEFTDQLFFQKLAKLQLDKSVAILAPSIISGLSGKDQNPYLVTRPLACVLWRWRMMVSTWVSYAIYQLLSNIRMHLQRAAASKYTNPARSIEIYAPHGALIIFANQFLEYACDLDRIPFLFAEELILGEICQRSNRVVLYFPELKVKHIEHATTSRIKIFRKYKMHKKALNNYFDYMNSN